MTHAAAAALDFPQLDPELFVIWSGNNLVWPEGGRRLSYLSAKRTDVMNHSALYTIHWSEAKTFKTKPEANAWLLQNRRKRGQAYDGVQITTVAELIASRFPEPKKQPKRASK